MTKKLGELLLLLVVAVIALNLIGSAVAPYLHWIGLTVSTAVILLVVLAVLALVIVLVRHLFGDSGGTFNG